MHYKCSFAALQSSNLMNLKLTDEGSLHYIIKHNITVVMTLNHNLVVDMTVLAQKAVDSGIEIE